MTVRLIHGSDITSRLSDCHHQRVFFASLSLSCMCDCMPTSDDFRFSSHHLLIELDAATNRLMMLVIVKEVSGPRWDEAATRQKRAFEAWTVLLNDFGSLAETVQGSGLTS
ncbi:hypothetical protein [Pseudomonas sp. NMS19W]|uniref:hypothetical protein n=1 Tax=Pseudomonas sp. NMS19W TaxID=3079768 RepID=UPI003F65AF0F